MKTKSPKGTQDGNLNHKMEKLFEYLDRVKNQKFTGYIKINFSQGSIGRIEKFEEILNHIHQRGLSE